MNFSKTQSMKSAIMNSGETFLPVEKQLNRELLNRDPFVGILIFQKGQKMI